MASGSILFAYLASHLFNHALGLASLGLAEAGLSLAVRFWHSLPGSALLYGAAAVHVSLAFVSVYERRTMRLPPIELLRIAMGFGMPTLLIGHVAFTRVAFEIHGLDPTYTRIVANLWRADSEGRQLALLVPGWIHGCLGLHLAWLRRPWYPRLRLALFGLALLLPVLSAIGFLTMGRALAIDPAPGIDAAAQAAGVAAAMRALAQRRDALVAAYFALIGALLLARLIRHQLEHRQGRLIALRYPSRSVQVPRGWTVLEASRAFGLPHVSLCGGRARCSTCRVRILQGAEHCPPPDRAEAATLARVRAGPDVRLACQLRPAGDLSLLPVLASGGKAAGPKTTDARFDADALIERDLSLLLVQIRRPAPADASRPGQDTLYEQQLVCDAVGAGVSAEGGSLMITQADGLLGVFGPVASNRSRTAASARETQDRRALRAAATIAQALNSREGPLTALHLERAAITLLLHRGPAVVGTIGYQHALAPAIAGAGWHQARNALELGEKAHRAAPGLSILVSAGLLTALGPLPDSAQGHEERSGKPEAARHEGESLETVPGFFSLSPSALDRLAGGHLRGQL